MNSVKSSQKHKIAIFASGKGSNAKTIIDYFKGHKKIEVGLIVCNNPRAGVLEIAEIEGIPVLLLQKNIFMETGYADELQKRNIGFIVLAGFLWKVPPVLIHAFPEKIVNIHPALLPNYGGKGMYGQAVHEAVVAAGEKESGITIHYIDEIYDNGTIIFQAKVQVEENDSWASVAKKVQELEHRHYAPQIEKLLTQS